MSIHYEFFLSPVDYKSTFRMMFVIPNEESGSFAVIMKNSRRITPEHPGDDLSKTVEAFKAWHRGERLSEEQRDLIEIAGCLCLLRQHGLAI